MQDAVDLRSVFLDDVDPEARDSQQLPCRSGPTTSDGSQYLVAEDAKRRHAASFGLGKTPGAQCLLYPLRQFKAVHSRHDNIEQRNYADDRLVLTAFGHIYAGLDGLTGNRNS